MDPIVPEPLLQAQDVEIRALLHSAELLPVEAEREGALGRAFMYYLVFSDARMVQQLGFVDAAPVDVFYNRYYWFLRYIRVSRKRKGYDAGLEQQMFQLLENAECAFDWEIIHLINGRVEQEILESDRA